MGRAYNVKFKFTKHWYADFDIVANNQKEAMEIVRAYKFTDEQWFELCNDVGNNAEDENEITLIKAARIKETE